MQLPLPLPLQVLGQTSPPCWPPQGLWKVTLRGGTNHFSYTRAASPSTSVNKSAARILRPRHQEDSGRSRYSAGESTETGSAYNPGFGLSGKAAFFVDD